MKLNADEIVQTVRGLSKNFKRKVIDDVPEAISETGDWMEVIHQKVLALDLAVLNV